MIFTRNSTKRMQPGEGNGFHGMREPLGRCGDRSETWRQASPSSAETAQVTSYSDPHVLHTCLLLGTARRIQAERGGTLSLVRPTAPGTVPPPPKALRRLLRRGGELAWKGWPVICVSAVSAGWCRRSPLVMMWQKEARVPVFAHSVHVDNVRACPSPNSLLETRPTPPLQTRP